jgi:riboflavin synthase
MFTGIIETVATITDIVRDGSNIHYELDSPIAHELKIDQSLAHNGVCLTVTAVKDGRYHVTAVAETLAKTTLGDWQKGYKINCERALRVGDRLDGHFVQGHVDATVTCISKQTLEGSWLFTFRFPEQFAALVIEKGSICLNGVSLTVFNVGRSEFTVTIIPYTYTHTNFNTIEEGCRLNAEFDVFGKYLLRQRELSNT